MVCIGYTPRARLSSDLATECHRHKVAKSLGNQARGVQPACTMHDYTKFKNQVDKQHCPEVEVDDLVINLLLANLKLVIVQVTVIYTELASVYYFLP